MAPAALPSPQHAMSATIECVWTTNTMAKAPPWTQLNTVSLAKAHPGRRVMKPIQRQ